MSTVSQDQRFKNVLASIQKDLFKLGSTYRSRWEKIQSNSFLTFEELVDILQKLGNPSSEEDIQMICEILDLSFPSLTYSDFLILLTEDASQFPTQFDGSNVHYPTEPLNLNNNDLIKNNLIQILNYCRQNDRLSTGKVHQNIFMNICQKFHIKTHTSDFLHLMNESNESRNGYLSYFLFAHQFSRGPQIEQSRSKTNSIRNSSLKRFHAPPVESQSSTRKEDLNEKFPFIPKFFPQNQKELILFISEKVQENFSNLKYCYNKWRGMDEQLSAFCLRNGLARDAKILFPLSDIKTLVNGFGSEFLSLSDFIKLIQGFGPDEIPQFTMTFDEEEIYNLAQQLHDIHWSDIIYNSEDNVDLFNKLYDAGVQIKLSILKRLISKYGRMGLIDALFSLCN